VVKLLTFEDVRGIHHGGISAAAGGTAGLPDIGRIEAAVARMKAGFAPVELYPGVFEKAAVLLEA